MFDKNQETFLNCLQERIWEYGTQLLPLDITLPYVPEELKDSCADYYNFNYNLLTDMYNNISEYGFIIDESQPDWMNNKQIDFYFCFLGGLSNLIGNKFIIPIDRYKKFSGKFNQKSINALSRHGIKVNVIGDNIEILNTIYTKMFSSMVATGEAARTNYKVNCSDFVIHCDFRALVNYKRTYEDMHFALNDQNRHIAEQIHNYSIGLNIMPQKCDYFYRVEYKLKGKIVYVSDMISKNQFKINIGFAKYNSAAYKLIECEIEKYEDADELKSFCLKYFSKSCVNCNEHCETKKNPINMFGKKKIICGYNPFIRIINPKEQDLKYLYKLIQLREMVINQKISEPFYPGNG